MVTIPRQTITPVAFEQGYEGLSKVMESRLEGRGLRAEGREISVQFSGKALVIKGYATKSKESLPDKHIQLSIQIDDLPSETIDLPTAFQQRRHDVHWNYALKPGDHKVTIRLLQPEEGYDVVIPGILYYQ
jgi:hypothetical protein